MLYVEPGAYKGGVMDDLKCKKHPRYRARLQPRCDCDECWVIWRIKNELLVPGDPRGR